jgi:LAO/AO transport system kinase
MKAGLMEVADLFVVNKADRSGADRLKKEIRVMIGLRSGRSPSSVSAHHGIDLSGADLVQTDTSVEELPSDQPPETWEPPVLTSVATTGEGVSDLAEALDRHYEWMSASGNLEIHRSSAAVEHARMIFERTLEHRGAAAWQQWINEVEVAGELAESSPYATARRLAAKLCPPPPTGHGREGD